MLSPVKPTKKRRLQFILKAVLLLGAVGLALYIGRESYYASRYKGAHVLVLGHAGSGFFSPLNPVNTLPPNSKASIVKAIKQHGADGVEVDVQLSRDGVPILYHDVTLASMTEKQDTIENLNASEVVGLAYKGGFIYDLFHREKIITLEELLQLFRTYPEPPYLHLDLRNHDPARYNVYAQTLVTLLRQYDYPLQKLAYISPDPDLLAALRKAEPGAALIIDANGDYGQAMQTVLERGFQGICINGGDITAGQVQEARQQGLQVVLFGGKANSRIARMIRMQPDAVQVNDVAAMRRMLD